MFPNRRGDYLLPATLAKQFTQVLKDVGLPHMRFHDLRHSAAMLLLGMGVPMKVVQELLGHSNFNTMANVYSHVLPSMQLEAMEKMDAFLNSNLDDKLSVLTVLANSTIENEVDSLSF